MKITTAQTAAKLLEGDNYLILTHRKPDGDTTGCAAALCRALRSLGKSAYVLFNLEFPPRYGVFLEGLTYPGEPGPSYTAITVDMASTHLFPDNAQTYADRIGLAIDHHSSNTFYAKSTCVFPDMSSCGEVVYQVIKDMGAAVTKEIAMALYLAVSTDTGCFKYANTTANSHRVVAELMETGIDVSELNYDLFMLKPKKRMDLEHRILNEIEFYSSGRVAVTYITREMLEATEIDERDTEDISCLPRQLEGVEIGVMIREGENRNYCKISIRTSGAVNASDVCAVFGGGGHLRAGGFTMRGSRFDSRSKVLAALFELHPELRP